MLPGMRGLITLMSMIAMLLASCSTGEQSPQTSLGTVQPTAAPVETSTTATAAASTSQLPDPSPTTAAPPTAVPDLTVFIAAIDDALEGTTYEGAALDDPEVFIGVGQLFCELLSEGTTVDAVLTEYLTALEDDATRTVAEDDAFVAGVIMGASIEAICPEHSST